MAAAQNPASAVQVPSPGLGFLAAEKCVYHRHNNIYMPFLACAYSIITGFEWDHKKAEGNLKKHGVDFADAVFIFDDLNAITIEDVHEREPRFISIGLDCFASILVVVYTWRGNAIRIISARKATKRE